MDAGLYFLRKFIRTIDYSEQFIIVAQSDKKTRDARVYFGRDKGGRLRDSKRYSVAVLKFWRDEICDVNIFYGATLLEAVDNLPIHIQIMIPCDFLETVSFPDNPRGK